MYIMMLTYKSYLLFSMIGYKYCILYKLLTIRN